MSATASESKAIAAGPAGMDKKDVVDMFKRDRKIMLTLTGYKRCSTDDIGQICCALSKNGSDIPSELAKVFAATAKIDAESVVHTQHAGIAANIHSLLADAYLQGFIKV
jgi:hypothetical protein